LQAIQKHVKQNAKNANPGFECPGKKTKVQKIQVACKGRKGTSRENVIEYGALISVTCKGITRQIPYSGKVFLN
jgi:hypothetical protein